MQQNTVHMSSNIIPLIFKFLLIKNSQRADEISRRQGADKYLFILLT